jgi:hypothetical protein
MDDWGELVGLDAVEVAEGRAPLRVGEVLALELLDRVLDDALRDRERSREHAEPAPSLDVPAGGVAVGDPQGGLAREQALEDGHPEVEVGEIQASPDSHAPFRS